MPIELTKEQRDYLKEVHDIDFGPEDRMTEAEYEKFFPPEPLADVVTEKAGDLAGEVSRAVVEYGPQALNLLDIPSGLARTYLLNPEGTEELLQKFKSSGGFKELLKKGIADPEKLVEKARASGKEGALTSLYSKAEGGAEASGFRKGAVNLLAGALLDPFVLTGLFKAPVNIAAKLAAQRGSGLFAKAARGFGNLVIPKSGAQTKALLAQAAQRRAQIASGRALPQTRLEKLADLAEKGADQLALTAANPYRLLGETLEKGVIRPLYGLPFRSINRKVTSGAAGSLKGKALKPSHVAYEYGQLLNRPESFKKTVSKIMDLRRPLEEAAVAEGKLIPVGPIREGFEDFTKKYYREPSDKEKSIIENVLTEGRARLKPQRKFAPAPPKKGLPPPPLTDRDRKLLSGEYLPFETVLKEQDVTRDVLPRSTYVESLSPIEPLRKQGLERLDYLMTKAKNEAIGDIYSKTGKQAQSAIEAAKRGGSELTLKLPMVGNLLDLDAQDAFSILGGLYGRTRRISPVYMDNLLKEGLIETMGERED